MTEKKYEQITAWFRKDKKRVIGLNVTNKILTSIVYLSYLALLLAAFLMNAGFVKILLISAISFGAVSIFRKFANAKRPYESMDIDPLIKRDKKGQSFPSRHVFSVFIIATLTAAVWMPGGIILWILGLILAWVRVVGGVHWPKDVVAGAIIGIGCGCIFWLVS